jgi:hypothetical protein
MDTIIVAVATVVAIISSLYLFGLSQVQFLKKNWVQYRCNPVYMPMAGMVGDDVLTNFTKCTMKGFHDYAGFIMDPVMAEFSTVNTTLSEVGDTMNSMRSMFSGVRGGFLGILGTVFGKIQNVMSQTQYIVIRMRTLLSRVVGVLFSFVYVFYTGMESGQSLVNGPVGKTMSFLCFDKNTEIELFGGVKKPMKDVTIGDRLANMAIVTSMYAIDGTDVPMYNINGVIVSASHKVKYGKRFIRVDLHPASKKVDTKCERLVCFNTSTHRIVVNGIEFLDFVESTDINILEFKDRYIQNIYNKKPTKSKLYDGKTGVLQGTKLPMFGGIMKEIEMINIGDVLETGDRVRGLCVHRVKNSGYVEVTKNALTSPSTWVYKNGELNRAETVGRHSTDPTNVDTLLFQLITDSSMYPVVSPDGSRIMLLDELETTERFYHALKDSIISNGRFRGKIVVV